MLPFVILQPFSESKSRIVKSYERRVISSSRNPVETENRHHGKCAIVKSTYGPRVASKLAAGTVVRICAKNSNTRRIDGAVVSNNVSNNVIRNCCRNLVMRIVQTLRQMRGAE